MPNLSSSGGRSSGVNYATASMIDRMKWSLQNAPHKQRGAQVFAVAYQSVTGASAGSLTRVAKGIGYNNIRY